jgi:hypothetical protein
MFLQTVGLLPDNVIILSTTRTKAEERIKDKLSASSEKDNLARLSVDETELNLAAVKEIYKGFFCEINTNEKTTDSIIEEIAVRIF